MNIYSEINQDLLLTIELEDRLNINSPIITKKNHFKTHFANGIQKSIYTGGLCILIQKFTVLHNCIHTLNIEKDYIQVSLLLQGKATIESSKNKTIHGIKPGILQMTYQNKNNIKIKIDPYEKTFYSISIFISKPFIFSILKNEKWFLDSIFCKDIQRNTYSDFNKIVLPIDFTMLTVINELIEIKDTGVFGHSYYQIKLKELFLKIFIKLSTNNKEIKSIKEEDFKKIELANAYLTTHYEEPPTINQLSKIIHLNELKLKTGFKQAYSCTIHYYIIQLRMKKALQMLNNHYPINEIALATGYKSTSHFITSFKKMFGKTPKQYILDDSL